MIALHSLIIVITSNTEARCWSFSITANRILQKTLPKVLELTMKKMKLVMIGNGMAGVRTLEELLKIAPDLYDITVFGAEPYPN